MAFQAEPPGFGGYRWQAPTWARWNSLGDPRFRVANSTALQPSVNTSAVRSINVAAGDIDCCGISGTNATQTVTFPANTGAAERWDALVARVNWATKTITLEVVTGGAAPPSINTGASVVGTQINWIPGVQYDGVIAIVRVPVGAGIFGPSNLDADVRLWGSSGGLVSNSTKWLGHQDVPEGASLRAATSRYWKQGGTYVLVPAPSVATSGTLTAATGWASYNTGQFPIGWNRSPDGLITLEGLVRRTGANLLFSVGEEVQFVGDLPSVIIPPFQSLQVSFMTLSGGAVPCLVRISATGITVIACAGGGGTMVQNSGYVSLNGVTWNL